LYDVAVPPSHPPANELPEDLYDDAGGQPGVVYEVIISNSQILFMLV